MKEAPEGFIQMSLHYKLKASLRTTVPAAEGEEGEENLCVKYSKCLKGSSGPPQDYLRLTRDGFLNSGGRRRLLDTLATCRWQRLKALPHKTVPWKQPSTDSAVKSKVNFCQNLIFFSSHFLSFEVSLDTFHPLGRPSSRLFRQGSVSTTSEDKGLNPTCGRPCTFKERRRLQKEFL